MKVENNCKKVLIFGANGEIGQATASMFSRKGFEVGLVGNRITPLKKLKKELVGVNIIQLLDVKTGSHQENIFDEVMKKMKGVQYFIICPEITYLDRVETKDPFAYRKTLIQMNDLLFSCIFEMIQVETCHLIIFPSVACGIDDSQALHQNPYQNLMNETIKQQQEVLETYNKALAITSVNFKKDYAFIKIKNGKRRKIIMDQLIDDLYTDLMEQPLFITVEGY